jgi:hypothetical protein
MRAMIEGAEMRRAQAAGDVRGPLGRTAARVVHLGARYRVDAERQAAYREARKVAGQLLEVADRLQVVTDRSELIELQETGRDGAEEIVRLLTATGFHAPSRRGAGLELVHAVGLLDDALGLAEWGLTGARHAALDLALVVRDRMDHIAGLEPAEGAR